jgi:dihydroneopterin aldolase
VLTTISIADLQISCIIGVLEHERTTKQLVSVDVEMTFDGRSAATSESIELTHDYSAIASQIEFILSSGEFMLIESAAHLILRHLLLPPTDRRPRISAAKVTITKSEALAGTTLAAVTVQGNGADTTYIREELGICRHHRRDGSAWPLQADTVTSRYPATALSPTDA